MHLANVNSRATVLTSTDALAGVDVADASSGAYGPDLPSLYETWDSFRGWAATIDPAVARPIDRALLRNPSPFPKQVFAIGLNYRAHAAETGRDVSAIPATFTKFPTCLAGPFDDIPVGDLPHVDWEVELVVIIGRDSHKVDGKDAWAHVAGLCVGQDISDRTLQNAAGGQFSLGKSRAGFGPMGPWLTTPDSFSNPDDLALSCTLDGEVMQDSRTSDLVAGVPALIEVLSSSLTLLPGDVIFTGTPSGVGAARTPPRFLRPGQVLETTIEGIGSLRNRIV